MEVDSQISDPLKFKSSLGHYKSPRISGIAFEIRVMYLRIVSNLDMQNSMKIIFPPRDLKACLQVNGLKIDPYVKISRTLSRHRSDAFMSESIYVNTDRIKFSGLVLPFEIHMQGSVLVKGALKNKGDGFNGSDVDCLWFMECKEGEDTEMKGGGLVDVYFAGSSGRPVILNGVVELKKCKELGCIPEEEEATNHTLKERESEEKMIKEFEGGFSSPHYREQEEMFIEEDGEMSWFNAGVRVGMGIGLGMCIGVGVGVGLIMRTYQSTTRAFRRLI